MNITTIPELIGAHPLFADLSPDDLDLIAGCGQNQRFAAGSLLVREGESADRFFLIRSGLAAVQVHAPGTDLVIETLGPGDVVGWSWLFPPHRWAFDVQAIEPTQTVMVAAFCLLEKCDADPAFGYRIMQRFAQVVIDRLQATRLRLLDLYGADRVG